jgi:S1-C subfamily serine protease
MTFLDDVPQDWTRPELHELRDLLVQAYPRRSAAEELADLAGIVPGMFPEAGDMRSTWTTLIRVMGNQGKLRPLVERASADPMVAAFRPRLAEMLSADPAVQPPQGLPEAAGWWRGDDDVPVVARRLLEERLMERRSRLIGIELATAVAAAARSVARLSLRFGVERGHGTGFLIGPDLLLTNHHNTVHPEHGHITALVAEFDFDQAVHDEEPLVRVARTDGIVGDPADDWAVLQLTAATDRPPLRLGSPFPVGIDDLVVVIQHPQGAFKQFSLEPLAVRFVDDARIQYVADTQQGSSGSPVFNERMHVIGLHQGEAEVQVAGTDRTVWHNQGIHIGRVMSGLRQRGIEFVQQ